MNLYKVKKIIDEMIESIQKGIFLKIKTKERLYFKEETKTQGNFQGEDEQKAKIFESDLSK